MRSLARNAFADWLRNTYAFFCSILSLQLVIFFSLSDICPTKRIGHLELYSRFPYFAQPKQCLADVTILFFFHYFRRVTVIMRSN